MRVIQAIPKDLHILTDISLSELASLDEILNNMVFNFDADNPAHQRAREYLEENLVPFVTKTLEEFTDAT